jgi:glycine dehydrogenase subunit 2
MSSNGTSFREPLIFDIGGEGRTGYALPALDVPEADLNDVLGQGNVRETIPGFPEVSEVEVVRHYYRLSKWNYCIENGLYRISGFADCHPLRPTAAAQGNLELLHRTSELLAEITGMDAVTLHPCAGSHGELTGMMLVKAHFDHLGEQRRTVLIPDSAHGTNPASAVICGFQAKEIPSGPDGCVDLAALEAAMDDDVAALMLTNPNTLGIFEKQIDRIAEIVHGKGGLVYMDGANMNALMGKVRPGDTGVDVLHLNLHKTFSTPHGGGGPGSGPVAVKKILEPYLPLPVIVKAGEGSDACFGEEYDRPLSIGRIGAFFGNFGVVVRALSYILSMGAEGLERVTEMAVLNANYIRKKLEPHYHLKYDAPVLHEVVFDDKHQAEHGVSVGDMAKRLLDFGFHPPTVSFPLIVHGAIMIEPTETEPREELDRFIEAMIQIAGEAASDPELIKGAPRTTPVSRLDEVTAARKPVLRWQPEDDA